jgi:propanediol dehydratase small subunit
VRWALFDGFAARHTKKRLKLELLRLRHEYDLQNRNYVYETKKLEKEIEKNIVMQKVSKQTTETLKNIETMAKKLGRKRLIRQTAVIKKELIKITQEMEIEIDKAKQAYAIKKLELLTKGTRQCDLP